MIVGCGTMHLCQSVAWRYNGFAVVLCFYGRVWCGDMMVGCGTMLLWQSVVWGYDGWVWYYASMAECGVGI